MLLAELFNVCYWVERAAGGRFQPGDFFPELPGAKPREMTDEEMLIVMKATSQIMEMFGPEAMADGDGSD